MRTNDATFAHRCSWCNNVRLLSCDRHHKPSENTLCRELSYLANDKPIGIFCCTPAQVPSQMANLEDPVDAAEWDEKYADVWKSVEEWLQKQSVGRRAANAQNAYLREHYLEFVYINRMADDTAGMNDLDQVVSAQV